MANDTSIYHGPIRLAANLFDVKRRSGSLKSVTEFLFFSC